MRSRRWQNGLRGAGNKDSVKRHFSKIADPITKQAMGVDSSGLIKDLPRPMIRWFAELANKQVVTEYKVVEVPVMEPSERYETENLDGSIVDGDDEESKCNCRKKCQKWKNKDKDWDDDDKEGKREGKKENKDEDGE